MKTGPVDVDRVINEGLHDRQYIDPLFNGKESFSLKDKWMMKMDKTLKNFSTRIQWAEIFGSQE